MGIKNILNGQSKTITSAAVVIGAASLASRLLGVFRDRVLAGEFGAGDVLDAYFAAFKIPDLVYNLLILGALSAGFIPVFVRIFYNDKKESEAWKLVNDLLNIMAVGLVVISAIFVLIMPYLMPFIAPGFSDEKLQITIGLSRIMFLSPIFLGLSNIFGGILQSFKRFFVYSLAPIFYNFGIIAGALFLVPRFGVYGLALGVVLGAFLHLLTQIPTSLHLGYHYAWSFNFKSWGIKRILRMMIPRTLGLAVTQINLVFMTIIASLLASGSLTIFNLANNLQSFPVGIFGVSFAIAAFPALSELATREDKGEFIKNFSNTTRQILFFLVPLTILFIVLRIQIVRVVLGSGQFDWEDTIVTAQTLAWFSFSLFAQALLPLLVRSFFAFHDSRTPFYIGLMSVVLNIALGWPLSLKYGIVGLALAFSISSIVNLILLWVLLKKRIHNLDEKYIAISVLKFSIAGFFMAIFTQGMKYVVEPFFGTDTFIGIFLQGFIAGLVGLGVYSLICLWLKSPEMIVFYNSLRRRLIKQALPEIESISEGEEI
jgi:putative peptidoglycan lipid II flippase